MRDLNADVVQITNPRNQKVADFLELFGLVELLVHFKQKMRFQYKKTWWKVRQGNYCVHNAIIS